MGDFRWTPGTVWWRIKTMLTPWPVDVRGIHRLDRVLRCGDAPWWRAGGWEHLYVWKPFVRSDWVHYRRIW